MDLGTAFAVSVMRQPEADAIVDGQRRLTYAQWYAQIRVVAGGLRAMGLKAGDHLVVVMRNRYEMATLYWASHLLGVVFTPVSWRASQAEIAYCIEDADAAAVAYDGASGDAAPQASAECKIKCQIVAADGRGDGVRFETLFDACPVDGPAALDPFSACLMLYTSGTTGRPKGVPRSHSAELSAAIAQIAQNQYRRHESALGVMPLFHTMGIRILLGSALLNGKFVCQPVYSPAEVLRQTAEEKISSIFLVPTMFHDVLRDNSFGSFDLTSLSRVGYAGMTMTQALIERCRDMLKPDLFVNYYGSSEIYTFSYCDRLDLKPGSAGRAGMNQIIRVVPADAENLNDMTIDLPPNEPGEIIASMLSPEAFRGYWKRPDADAKSIQGAWYRTGDLGERDEDGELYVVGRVDDMIVSGGENIFPEEVENVLTRSALIAGVAVAGIPDERLGSRVVAFVEAGVSPLPGNHFDDLCAQHGLARFKRPREYIFVKAIPRSASGKILRRMLRAGEYEQISNQEGK